MNHVIKRKSRKVRVRFKAGYWDVFLQTAEGTKTPLFRTFNDRLLFTKDFDAKIIFRRMR